MIVRHRIKLVLPFFVPQGHRWSRFNGHGLMAWHLKNGMRKPNGIQENITPHAFRRGHANFLFSRAVDMADLVAAQNNLMHESLTTTEVYARQYQEQTRKRIFAMSQRNEKSPYETENKASEDMKEIKQMMEKLLERER